MAASAGLYAYGAIRSNSLEYSYLLWNLVLAALPLMIAIRLVNVLRTKRWSAWEPTGITLLWLLFLPNSFYMISDFIHLRAVGSDDILYAAVLFTSFIYLGVLLGFCSLLLVHHELRRRLKPSAAASWIGATLLLCSFAIYIGRDLRWNSWDVIFNPGGLLFDISDRILRPDDYPMMFVTVLSFFALLGSLYVVVWSGARLLRLVDPNQASAYPHLPRRHS
jgi:uncharacterized membrane protein